MLFNLHVTAVVTETGRKRKKLNFKDNQAALATGATLRLKVKKKRGQKPKEVPAGLA